MREGMFIAEELALTGSFDIDACLHALFSQIYFCGTQAYYDAFVGFR